MEPIGAHQFWGFSPALDLKQMNSATFGPQGLVSLSSSTVDNAAAFNMLLVSPGDARHVLKTIAQRRRHSAGGSMTPLHFFVYERSAETLARIMLQLAIACDWETPLRQRAALWLEVFGNAMIQTRTSKYLSTKLKSVLIDVLCNERGPAPLPQIFDFSLLKYRQRDELEAIFKSWDDGSGYTGLAILAAKAAAGPVAPSASQAQKQQQQQAVEAPPFDMATLRDYRLRHHYQDRYDYRVNLMDWDYQQGVRPHAAAVHWSTFKEWRQTGVAFEFGDCKYDAPNRTLASYVEGKEAGRGSVARRGFWGDVVVGPFHAVGTAAYVLTDTEAEAAALARRMQAEELKQQNARAAGAEAAAAAVAAASAGSGSSIGSSSIGSSSSSSSNYAWQLFDIQGRHLGTEQWRHHSTELAVYNVLSWLFEIETGRPYVMRREHDVYSGLGEANVLDVELPTTPVAASTAESSAAPPAPSPEAAALLRSAAVLRARTIAKSFENVTITFLSSGPSQASITGGSGSGSGSAASVAGSIGDFESDWLVRGGSGVHSRLASRFHCVTLSGRTVHLMDKPGFASLARPPVGAAVVAETARNILHLRKEQQVEFARRVVGMAGASLGAALVSSDRALSADTFSVGTVLDLTAPAASSSKDDTTSRGEGTPFFPPDAKPFLPAMLRLPGDSFSPSYLSTSTYAGADIYGKQVHPSPDAADAASSSSSSSFVVKRRVKGVPFSDMTARTVVVGEGQGSGGSGGGSNAAITLGLSAPHPAVAPLLKAAATPDSLGAAAEGAADRLRRAVVAALPGHNADKGDNPPPEALVFAVVPGTTDAVKEAFGKLLKVKPGDKGGVSAPAAEEDATSNATNSGGSEGEKR